MTDHQASTEAELIEQIRNVDVAAPAALHSRVAALVAERSAERSRGRSPLLWLPARPALAGLATAILLAVALAVGLSGGGGASSAPQLRAAAGLTLGQATLPAPTESVSNRGELNAGVDGVSFPYWQESFGWRSVGARDGSIGGRPVRTVYYSNARGQRIGYSILAGATSQVSGGTVRWRDGTAYRVLHLDGAQVVAWLRGGRLCVVSGRGVDSATLLRLASWQVRSVAA
jgi:hypothetical protein